MLINQQNEVLIAKRQAHQLGAGLWEFPGGKIEAGESAFAALQREFQEEIGIHIISAESWFTVNYTYPTREVALHTWMIGEFTGEARGVEGQIVQWVQLAELDGYEFPAGNKEILRRLQLSSC